MSRKSAHPDLSLLDYLSGALDQLEAREVERHLEGCKDCASVAGLIGVLRSEYPNLKSQISNRHPDVDELARLFYSRPSAERRRAESRATAAHIAICRSCAEELAHYARAERAASNYTPARDNSSAIPDAAWEMIREWDATSGPHTKTLSRVESREVFAELAELLSGRKEELREMAREQIARDFEKDFPDKLELVPVIIVDRAGQFRGVEMFEKANDPRGASVLKQVEKTNRFDKKPFQAFLDFGEKSNVVISDLVRRDTVRLQHVTHPDRTLRDADYFIIEE
jgi:hypothetical protein